MAFPHDGKKFKKGESGNPAGRPKKLPELDTLLADVLGEERDGIEAAKAILIVLRKKALKGDIRAAEVLLARGYGLPTTKVDVTSQGEKLTNSLIIVEKPPGEGSEPDPD